LKKAGGVGFVFSCAEPKKKDLRPASLKLKKR
jgi:hypothetical protein